MTPAAEPKAVFQPPSLPQSQLTPFCFISASNLVRSEGDIFSKSPTLLIPIRCNSPAVFELTPSTLPQSTSPEPTSTRVLEEAPAIPAPSPVTPAAEPKAVFQPPSLPQLQLTPFCFISASNLVRSEGDIFSKSPTLLIPIRCNSPAVLASTPSTLPQSTLQATPKASLVLSIAPLPIFETPAATPDTPAVTAPKAVFQPPSLPQSQLTPFCFISASNLVRSDGDIFSKSPTLLIPIRCNSPAVLESTPSTLPQSTLPTDPKASPVLSIAPLPKLAMPAPSPATPAAVEPNAVFQPPSLPQSQLTPFCFISVSNLVRSDGDIFSRSPTLLIPIRCNSPAV